MIITIDQLNNSILLDKTPKRIVSLVPSITELLVDLGLEQNLVGITKFCNEPAFLKETKKIVGGTKNISIHLIKELHPDFVIANKEENIEEQISQLQKITNVWVSDIKTLSDNYELIFKLGELFNKSKEATEIIIKTKSVFKEFNPVKFNSKKVLYLIWKNPYMSVGQDTFIHAVLSELGFENSIKENRYPQINLDDFKSTDFIFLSTEPFPFSNKDAEELKISMNNSEVFVVDGTYFSWYGSRISKSNAYFKELFCKLMQTT